MDIRYLDVEFVLFIIRIFFNGISDYDIRISSMKIFLRFVMNEYSEV